MINSNLKAYVYYFDQYLAPNELLSFVIMW